MGLNMLYGEDDTWGGPWAKPRVYATLNPKEYFNEGHKEEYSEAFKEEISVAYKK